MNQQEIYGIAKALQLAGGVVAVVLAVLGILSGSYHASGSEVVRALFLLGVGLVALGTQSRIKTELIQILLIVLGLIAGTAGGDLIALAGIVALVARFTGPSAAMPQAQVST